MNLSASSNAHELLVNRPQTAKSMLSFFENNACRVTLPGLRSAASLRSQSHDYVVSKMGLILELSS